MLMAQDLRCVRGDKIIFENLGFCLDEGGLLILRGANGSGKTTLLQHLSGLLAPEYGDVCWNGTPIRKNPEFLPSLCYVGHKNAIKLALTVGENLRFWARMYGREMVLQAAMRFFDLERMEHVRARDLSAGWQRRVALTRLLLSPAKLWLLDEPTNFLDEEAVMLFTSMVESRVQQGGIVVIASHTVNSSFPAHMLRLEDFA